MSLNSGFVNSTVICSEKKDVDLDALNLLASGEILVFCQCSYKNETKHHHFIYNTDGFMPLSQLQAGLSFENVIEILSSTAEMIQILTDNNLILDNVKNAKEYIFKSYMGYKFVYIPIVHKSHLSVKDYLIKLMAVISHKDVRLSHFVKELRKKKDDEQILTYLNSFVDSYMPHSDYTEDATSLLVDNEETTVLSQENYSDEEKNFNTIESLKLTEFFEDESSEFETTVLTSQPLIQNKFINREVDSEYFLQLIRSLNGEKIIIDVTPFMIGKDSFNMDFVLNNDSVSRHHATIIYEDGDYFIIDNNSTNGTIIEGIRLQPNEKCEIGNGYIISLGNESFQAYIERR